jgi:diacylglycerol kinase family enzyme
VLLINPRSGGGKAAHAALAEHARERGIEAVVMTADRTVAALIGEALDSGADALAIAGGDGSLAVVAAAACAHALPFVCIPAGTRNHFARDLGVDVDDLVGALDALTDGVERRIDVGLVNGRMFLNNVSLGIYGDAVRRPEYREAKVRTLLETVAAVIGPGARMPSLQLVDDVGREHTSPIVVLVSNNPYALEFPLGPGARPTLDSGELGILVLDPPEIGPYAPSHSWRASSLELSAPETLHAGMDGEAVELGAQLHFVAQPAALRVRISRRHPGASAAQRTRPGPS